MENIQSVPIAASISDSSDSTSGLTINDLNKYLPALQTIEDLSMTREVFKTFHQILLI
jgi:hypothetical protein